MNKQCSICKAVKPITEYHSAGHYGGVPKFKTFCKVCNRKKVNEKYQKNHALSFSKKGIKLGRPRKFPKCPDNEILIEEIETTKTEDPLVNQEDKK